MTQLVDRMGRGVDPGIADTVVALRLSGVHTTSSCEGHERWGVCAPWVSVSAPPDEQLRELDRQRRTALAQSEELRKNGAQAERVVDADRRVHEARRAGKAIHLRVLETVLALLEEFYSGRQVPVDRRLVLMMVGNGGAARLQSQGAELQEVAAAEHRARKLGEYQREMNEFTTFLKHKLAGGPSGSLSRFKATAVPSSRINGSYRPSGSTRPFDVAPPAERFTPRDRSNGGTCWPDRRGHSPRGD